MRLLPPFLHLIASANLDFLAPRLEDDAQRVTGDTTRIDVSQKLTLPTSPSSFTGMPATHGPQNFHSSQNLALNVGRPIYGIIVRVKQCKGNGFDDPNHSEERRRSASM